MPQSLRSSSFAGSLPDLCLRSALGSGRARLSTLPLPVMGRLVRCTNTLGTMYGASDLPRNSVSTCVSTGCSAA